MLEFEAAPSSDGGGLYEELVISPDGTVSGTSDGGAVLEGLINANGIFSGVITPPGGEAIQFEVLVDIGEPGAGVVIILSRVEGISGRGEGVKESLPSSMFFIRIIHL